jgi:hypothetical protein
MAFLSRHGHRSNGHRPTGPLTAVLLTLAASTAASSLVSGSARADYNTSLSTQEQRLYDYGPGGSNGSPKGNSVLDTTNPLDLMNKIRKGRAMDDATNPTDAIDAALKELDAQAPRATAATPGSAVKAP